MKYINAFFEGSLLKYTLDEPLVAGNSGVYRFKLDISNFNEARNSEWKRLYESGCLCAISFKNDKNQNSTSDYLIIEKFIVNEGSETFEKTFLAADVPGSQLVGSGRLQFGIRFFINQSGSQLDTIALNDFLITEINGTTSYGTIELTNPPMVYPSNQFTTTIDITDDTRLSSLLSTLSGGSEDSILVKKTDGDYDVTWVTSLPGALIYGGSGSFDSNGQLNITLTPKAQELLVQSGAITVGQTEVALDPNTPELYDCLEFVVMADATTMNNTHNFGSIENVIASDKLISDGVSWKRVSAAQVAIDGTNLSVGTIKVGTKTLPNYRVAIGGQARNINLLSLGNLNTSEDDNVTNGLLSDTRNILNFANRINEFTLEGEDTIDHWCEIGNCTFYVDEQDFNLITTPKKSDGTAITGDAFIENHVFIQDDNKLVIQEWHGITDGKCFYRTNADWQNWYEYYNSNLNVENSIIPIEKGGTNATTVEQVRSNLQVYSVEEVDTALAQRVNTFTAEEQRLQGRLSLPALSIWNATDTNTAARIVQWGDYSENSPYIKLTGSMDEGIVFENRAETNESIFARYRFPLKRSEIKEIATYDILSTQNVWIKDSLPITIAPAGTICFVKVSE